MADKLKLVPVRLLFAHWPAEDVRVNAGEIVDLPLESAKAMIAEGKAERADPLPGDE